MSRLQPTHQQPVRVLDTLIFLPIRFQIVQRILYGENGDCIGLFRNKGCWIGYMFVILYIPLKSEVTYSFDMDVVVDDPPVRLAYIMVVVETINRQYLMRRAQSVS